MTLALASGLCCAIVEQRICCANEEEGQRASSHQVDFNTEVMPILSKNGCNAAECHGSSAGQGSFRLSLFGGDSELDHRRIVLERKGRRVNLVHATSSLLLRKPTERLEHGGGLRLMEGSPGEAILKKWIQQGAQRDPATTVDRIDVSPTTVQAETLPHEVKLDVSATLDDGSLRNVTQWAIFSSNDTTAVSVDRNGIVTVHRGGQHVVLVRFCGHVEPVQIIAPLSPTRDRQASTGSAEPSTDSADIHWIDRHIDAKLATVGIPPSPLASDLKLFRRLHLDLTGRLPTSLQSQNFLSRDKPDYDKLVEDILDSEPFVAYWTYRLSSMLRIHTPGADTAAAEALFRWLGEQLRVGAPWNETVRQLLLTTGDSHENGAAGFHRLANGPRLQAEHVAETLMGIRIRCANCHRHPLDRWTQDDYHGFAQIFAPVRRGREVDFKGLASVNHPQTGQVAAARILGVADAAQPPALADFAQWLCADNNPYLARSFVGYVWTSLMHWGLVEPYNDLRATNPPSHPKLFDELTDSFIESGYQLRGLVRTIVMSRAYRRDNPTPANANANRFYASYKQRPLPSEVLADAISDVTGIPHDFRDKPSVRRAIDLPDPHHDGAELRFLGVCDRTQSACSPRATGVNTIASQLSLLNGPFMNGKLVNSEGHVQRAIARKLPTNQVVAEFYLRSLSRAPTDRELKYWCAEIDQHTEGSATTRDERIVDFVWSLLCSSEFTHNQ